MNHCEGTLKVREKEIGTRRLPCYFSGFDIGAAFLFRKRTVAFFDRKLVDARFDGISPNAHLFIHEVHRKSSQPRSIDDAS